MRIVERGEQMILESKIRQIIIEQLGCNFDKVVPEARLVEDLGADSLDMVELVMCLEEELEIFIDDEDAEKLITVKDIILYCTAKVEGKC
jgi:acyl carrier protein